MKRGGAGRHDLSRVPDPISGMPALPTSIHNRRGQILPVAIADPYEPERRVRALARIDLLDRERRTGKIDEAQFLVGREIERILQDMSRISGASQWIEGNRIDAASRAEMAFLMGIESAFKVNAFLAWMVRHVGSSDSRLLYILLGCRFSFGTAAAAFDRKGVRGLRYTIDRFRDALAVLADAKAARGRAVREQR